jgi:hypothetical protein
MKKIISGFLVLLAGPAMAEVMGGEADSSTWSVCATITKCEALQRQVAEQLKKLKVGKLPTFLDIAREADGKVKYMTQTEAVQYCIHRGAHLPSALELAQLSMSYGAKGIVDSCGPKEENCYQVRAANDKGEPDWFYFSYAGYNRPAGDLGSNWFWSSSVQSGDSYVAFGLNGYDGGIGFGGHRSSKFAVRCVSGR